MKSEKLKIILAQHMLWLNSNGGERADLREANLRGTFLCRADLRKADLRGTDLRWADLREANLREADLREANLSGANLRGADIRWADLREANLSRADLYGADLRGALLCGTDLRGANLDFSCFPLWCGGSKFKCDTKLVYQLLAYIYTLEFDDTEGIKDFIMSLALQSHMAVNLGLEEESE